jgi:hypothetical protein
LYYSFFPFRIPQINLSSVNVSELSIPPSFPVSSLPLTAPYIVVEEKDEEIQCEIISSDGVYKGDQKAFAGIRNALKQKVKIANRLRFVHYVWICINVLYVWK